jgi:hypothetical protein
MSCELVYKILGLCVLCTLFLALQLNRRSGELPEDMDGSDWLMVLTAAVTFPLVWGFVFMEEIWPALVKERKLWH